MSNKEEIKTRFTTLYVDPVAMKRIMYYAQAADGEVSGLGTVIKDELGRYIVNNVYLLDQEASGADTELKPEAISELMVDMMKKNQDPAQLKFWWHSHVNMGVFWSGTDDTCAETLSHEFAFSLVVNKSGEKRCRLDLYNPFRITFDGVKVEELTQDDENLKELCKKEVSEKVKSSYGYNNGYNNWDREDYWGHGFRGNRGLPVVKPADSKIKLPEHLIEDIERLMDIATTNNTDGGVMCGKTWDEYIVATLKAIAEKRHEKNAGCTSFATYNKDYYACEPKQCKVHKQCAYWTKFFEDADAIPDSVENIIDATLPTVE